MDVVAGLNKLTCRSDDGTEVTVTDGINTWTKTIADGVAVFMIPSMPAPAKRTYTVSITGYTRDIELGYGDSLDITLDEDHEIAMKLDINTAIAGAVDDLQDDLDALTARVTAIEGWTRLTAEQVLATQNLLTKVNGKQLVSASRSGAVLTLTNI